MSRVEKEKEDSPGIYRNGTRIHEMSAIRTQPSIFGAVEELLVLFPRGYPEDTAAVKLEHLEP